MLRRAVSISLLLVLTLLTTAHCQAQLHFPRPTGWVNEIAEIIAKERKGELQAARSSDQLARPR